MKKLLISFALLISLVSGAFAENIFSHRFFEIKLDVDASVSNNLVTLQDFCKPDLVIDLPKIADSMGNNGFMSNVFIASGLSINLDIPNGIILGVNIGIEESSNLGLSKDIFDFIGHGNAGKSELKQSLSNTYLDLFATASVTGGWNLQNMKVSATGTSFWSLAHLTAGDSYIKVYNTEDGKFGAEIHSDASIYSTIDFNKDINDYNKIIKNTLNNGGFDITANVDYDLFRYLTLGATTRIPLVPSKLPMSAGINFKESYEVDLMDLLTEEDKPDPENGGGKKNDDLLTDAVILSKPYAVHRPFKLGASVDFHPNGTLLSTYGYLGLGVRHPFAKQKSETQAYIDYTVGGKLSLWNMFTIDLCHSYNDEVFKNQITAAFNLRLVEADLGVSYQSPSFTKCFSASGFGAFASVSIGF